MRSIAYSARRETPPPLHPRQRFDQHLVVVRDVGKGFQIFYCLFGNSYLNTATRSFFYTFQSRRLLLSGDSRTRRHKRLMIESFVSLLQLGHPLGP